MKVLNVASQRLLSYVDNNDMRFICVETGETVIGGAKMELNTIDSYNGFFFSTREKAIEAYKKEVLVIAVLDNGMWIHEKI